MNNQEQFNSFLPIIVVSPQRTVLADTLQFIAQMLVLRNQRNERYLHNLPIYPNKRIQTQTVLKKQWCIPEAPCEFVARMEVVWDVWDATRQNTIQMHPFMPSITLRNICCIKKERQISALPSNPCDNACYSSNILKTTTAACALVAVPAG